MTTAGSGEQGLDQVQHPLLTEGPQHPHQPLHPLADPPQPPHGAAARGWRDTRQAPSEVMSTTGGHGEWRGWLQKLVERPESSRAAAIFQSVIVILILASTVAVVVETMPEMRAARVTFFWLDALVSVIFTLELSLRFCACRSTTEFITNGFNIVDFLAILPGLVQTCMCIWLQTSLDQKAGAFMSLRMLRLMWFVRILRLAKVARYSQWLSVCIAVLTRVWHSSILVILGLLLLLTVVSSSLLYLVEMDRCEAVGVECPGFDSIPDACWFAIATLTTVGYGDVIPATVLGKILSAFFMICAVITLALAGALLSFDFAEHFREERERARLDLQGLLQGRGEEYQELQALLDEFKRSSDKLVVRLHALASREQDVNAGKAPPFVMVPMLRLIEDKARILNAEVQSCAYASALSTEDRGDIHELLSYAHNETAPEDKGLPMHLASPRDLAGSAVHAT